MAAEAAAADKVGWRQRLWPVSTILLTIGIFFIAQFLAAFLVILLAITVGRASFSSLQTDNGLLHTTAYQFYGNLAVSAALAALVTLALKLRGGNWAQIGFKRPKTRDIKLALGGYAVYFGLFLIISQLLYTLLPELLQKHQEIGFSQQTGGVALIPVFISLVIMPPIVEEMLVRGFLFSGLRQRLSFKTSTFIASGLFALAHLWGSQDGVIWLAAIDTFVLSVVLCTVRERSGRLWAPIMIHAAKNMVAFMALFIFAAS